MRPTRAIPDLRQSRYRIGYFEYSQFDHYKTIGDSLTCLHCQIFTGFACHAKTAWQDCAWPRWQRNREFCTTARAIHAPQAFGRGLAFGWVLRGARCLRWATPLSSKFHNTPSMKPKRTTTTCKSNVLLALIRFLALSQKVDQGSKLRVFTSFLRS